MNISNALIHISYIFLLVQVYKCKICFKKTVFNGNKKYQEACSFEEVNVTPASHKKKKNSLKNAGLFFSPLTNEM